MKYIISLIVFIVIINLSCNKDKDTLPSSEKISTSESGLIGIWEGITCTIDTAIATTNKNEFGSTLFSATSKTYSNTSTDTKTVFKEFLSLQTINGIDSFMFVKNVEELDSVKPEYNAYFFALIKGRWAIIKTHDPTGKKKDIMSITLYNNKNPHLKDSTFTIGITEKNDNRLVIKYSYGLTTKTALVTKTYQRYK